jgi:hypothetical protein
MAMWDVTECRFSAPAPPFLNRSKWAFLVFFFRETRWVECVHSGIESHDGFRKFGQSNPSTFSMFIIFYQVCPVAPWSDIWAIINGYKWS